MTALQPDIAALHAEVETLRARLDTLERIIQIRDALPAAPAPSHVSAAPAPGYVSAAPAPSHASAAPAPSHVSAMPAPVYIPALTIPGYIPDPPALVQPSAVPAPVAPAAPPLPTEYDVAADQLLPAQDGFYKLEWGPEGAFRWTGPAEDVHFEAWIDRSAPLHVAVTLFHLGTPANGKDMTLVVDGTVHPLLREGTSKLLRGGPIAPRAGDGPTRFTLHVPHVHSPSSRGAPDRRMLGVAFQRLLVARG